MLVFRRHAEVAEDQDEHEDIVDAEGLFDQVASEECQRGGAVRVLAGWHKILPEEIDAEIEEHRQRDPDRAPDRRLTHRDSVRFAVEYAQVERQQGQHEYIKANPQPDRSHWSIPFI